MTEGINSDDALRGLWLTRELPFPLDSGDKIYSAYLAKSLAEAGADLTIVGLQSEEGAAIPMDWPIRWSVVSGKRNSGLKSIWSLMPRVAAMYATQAYRSKVEVLAKENWDFVVFDQYGTGWALPYFRLRGRSINMPVLVHVSHDHEASVGYSLYKEIKGPLVKRIGLWQNHLKTRSFERRIVKRVDVVTAISREDAQKFSSDSPGVHFVVLTPGYSGVTSSRLLITAQTPRHVVLIGSFRWVAKQENLRRFMKAADVKFTEQNIELHVFGFMPPDFAKELTVSYHAIRVHGFIADIHAHFELARIALVPELIGGGFKLKFLDYIFGRVPVATLSGATAGLPVEIRDAMLCRDDMDGLVAGICEIIGKVDQLNRMQEFALKQATSLFCWQERGRTLLDEIRKRMRRAAV